MKPRHLTARPAESVLLLLLALGSCTGCLNDPPSELAVWSEFLPYEEVHKHLDALARFSAELYLRVRPGDLGEELWTLLESTEARGVRVRLWLQLPDEGTWLNEQNIAGFGDFARMLLKRAEENGIDVEWLIFDLEPELTYAQALRSAAARGDGDELLQLLSEHHDMSLFESASAELRALTDELHARDVRVMVATLPWTIDDLYDSDPDLQDVFDTPLVNVPWDQVCVMAYRPVFADMFGLPLSREYVASYARSALCIFGPTTQVAIGNIGAPGLLVPLGYTDPVDACLDISAARSAGIQGISLFSLDGMIDEGGVDRWLVAASSPTPWSMSLDPATGALRIALQWLDRVADQL